MEVSKNRICPLLSIVDNENGYLNCKRERCAWYCGGLKECSLKALVEVANEAVVVLEDIPVSLSEIADTIAER